MISIRNKWKSWNVGTGILAAALLSLAGICQLEAADRVWKWADVSKYDGHEDFPSEKEKAWTKERDLDKRRQLSRFIRELKKKDPSDIKALPAASDFPGIPADGTPLVDRKVNIDPRVPRWQSTGLYALPGVKVTVKFPDGIELTNDSGKPRYGLRIGVHRDVLSDSQKEWFRSPDLCFENKVSSPIATISSPFGGPLYVTIPEGMATEGKPFLVEVSGTIEMPLFILGKTDNASWKEQIARAAAPWGEIITPRLIVTLPKEYLEKIPDMEQLARHFQQGMQAQEWLAGWDALPQRKKSPMRFAVDRQITHGLRPRRISRTWYLSLDATDGRRNDADKRQLGLLA